MLPNATELEYFLEVTRTLNISRAAERLGVTQPTLSVSIQRLEHALGVQLLVRGKTGVQITKAGSRFAAQAKILLDHWTKLRAEALKEEQEVRGRFSIGCHPSVALYSLPHLLPGILGEHAGLEVALIHDLSRKITEKVISYEVDLGIVVNPVEHPDLVIIPLCTDEVTFWKAKECRNEDVLICDPELLQSQSLLAQMKAKGIHFKRNVPSSSLEVITSLVSHGAGVGILPGRVALRDPSMGLKKASPKSPVFKDRVCLIYRPDVQKGKAAQTLIAGIRKAFAESASVE